MSDDLIRRSDAIKAIHNYWKKRIETLPTKMSEYGEVYEDINEMNKILEHNKTLCSFVKAIPTIDIVRCKECKHYDKFPTWSACTYWSGDPYEQASVNDDDFCSYGEREGE